MKQNQSHQKIALLGDTLEVIDPVSGKLKIPAASVLNTKAIHRGGTPSLCLLFQAGQCRQGSKCHQAHADPKVVSQLRLDVMSQPTCCLEHGHCNAQLLVPTCIELTINTRGGGSYVVPFSRLAATVGLQSLFEKQGSLQLFAGEASICSLHAAGRCKYAKECKFLHICRETLASVKVEEVPVKLKDASQKTPSRPLSPEGLSSASSSCHSWWSHDPYSWNALKSSDNEDFFEL